VLFIETKAKKVVRRMISTGGRGNIVILPSNNENYMYIYNQGQAGFSINQFDEGFVQGRLRNHEFMEFIQPLNELAKSRANRMCLTVLCFICYIFLVVGAWVYVMVSGAAFNGGLAFFIIGYILALFIGIFGFIYCLTKARTDVSEFDALVARENQTRCHPRGLHWTIGPQAAYLQLYLRYDSGSGMMPGPMPPQPVMGMPMQQFGMVQGQPVHTVQLPPSPHYMAQPPGYPVQPPPQYGQGGGMGVLFPNPDQPPQGYPKQ
jgi:hypothetical protein